MTQPNCAYHGLLDGAGGIIKYIYFIILLAKGVPLLI